MARPLTAQDRCDSCGAQAIWSTWFGEPEAFDSNLLLWCQHHFTKFEVKLRAEASACMKDADMWNRIFGP